MIALNFLSWFCLFQKAVIVPVLIPVSSLNGERCGTPFSFPFPIPFMGLLFHCCNLFYGAGLTGWLHFPQLLLSLQHRSSFIHKKVMVVVVDFSLHARTIWGECLTNYSPPALFLFKAEISSHASMLLVRQRISLKWLNKLTQLLVSISWHAVWACFPDGFPR